MLQDFENMKEAVLDSREEKENYEGQINAMSE